MRINEKAVLVKLSIGMPGNTKKDKKITGEVQTANHLGEKAGRWMKTLYPPEAFDPIEKVATKARTLHYAKTLPWTDEGFRLLPTALHGEYCGEMRSLRHEYEGLTETHFIARLSEWEEWARKQHNGTFQQADYLPAEKLIRKFAFDSQFSPVPSGSDFRLNITAEEMERMSREVDSRVNTAVESAQADLWDRLVAPLSAMADRLKDPKAIFRDSLIGNLADIAALVPRLNLTADSTLSAFAAEVQAQLASLKPADLRNDNQARSEAQAKAQAILDRMKDHLPQ